MRDFCGRWCRVQFACPPPKEPGLLTSNRGRVKCVVPLLCMVPGRVSAPGPCTFTLFSLGGAPDGRRKNWPDRQRDEGGAAVPARRRSSPPRRGSARWKSTRSSGRRPPTTSRASGASWPANCTGSSRTTRCSSGTSRSPSGSSAARPTSRTTASTPIWARRGRTRPALIWEGEPGDVRVLTYQMLHREVCKFANVLKKLGIEQGRRRGDVHADGARAGHRHAGLRPDRRGPLGRLRRVLGRSHRRPQQRRLGQAAHHGRRRLAARQGAAAEGQRRRGPGKVAHRREVHRAASGPAAKSTCRKAATSGGTS